LDIHHDYFLAARGTRQKAAPSCFAICRERQIESGTARGVAPDVNYIQGLRAPPIAQESDLSPLAFTLEKNEGKKSRLIKRFDSYARYCAPNINYTPTLQ
jgi:hypothetical protein